MENYTRKKMQEETDVGNEYDDILQSQYLPRYFKILLMTFYMKYISLLHDGWQHCVMQHFCSGFHYL